MTPKAIRDAANGPWQSMEAWCDSPREQWHADRMRRLGEAIVRSADDVATAVLLGRRSPGPGEYHFPVDCPLGDAGECAYCLRRLGTRTRTQRET